MVLQRVCDVNGLTSTMAASKPEWFEASIRKKHIDKNGSVAREIIPTKHNCLET